jgi:hypothetical protein
VTSVDTFRHRFVEYIPRELDDGVIYVSIEWATAAHLCACGCRGRVITPLTPDDWKLGFDGETVSFWPSIGNWSFECESHYVIRHGKVCWKPQWSEAMVDEGRRRDRRRRGLRYGLAGRTEGTTPVSRPAFLQQLRAMRSSAGRRLSRRTRTPPDRPDM